MGGRGGALFWHWPAMDRLIKPILSISRICTPPFAEGEWIRAMGIVMPGVLRGSGVLAAISILGTLFTGQKLEKHRGEDAAPTKYPRPSHGRRLDKTPFLRGPALLLQFAGLRGQGARIVLVGGPVHRPGSQPADRSHGGNLFQRRH